MDEGPRSASKGASKLKRFTHWSTKKDASKATPSKRPQRRVNKPAEEALRPAAVFSQQGKLLYSYEELQAFFEAADFDADQFLNAHMRSLPPAGFKTAKSELDAFIKCIHDKVLDSAINNNEVYVQLCESAQGIEPSLQKLHGILTSLRTLVRSLQSMEPVWGESESGVLSHDSRTAISTGRHGRTSAPGGPPSTSAAFEDPWSLIPNWKVFMDHLELALAERRLHRVFSLVSAAQAFLADALQQCLRAPDLASVLPIHLWLERSEVYLQERRAAAIALLERAIMEPGVSRAEMQQNVRLLSKLALPRHALNCMLASYEHDINAFVVSLQERSGIQSDGCEMLSAISQRTFGTIGRAANDLALVFKKESRELSAPFTVWALRVTEHLVDVLAEESIRKFAAPLGLPTVMECVLVMVVYCACLEETHHICLRPHLLRVLWPYVEPLINAHVDSAVERIHAAAERDVAESVRTRRCAFPAENVSAASRVLLTEGRVLIDMVLALESVDTGRCMRRACFSLLRAFCEGIAGAVRRVREQGGQAWETLAPMREQVMANAQHIVTRVLTRALGAYGSKLGVLLVPQRAKEMIAIADDGFTPKS